MIVSSIPRSYLDIDQVEPSTGSMKGGTLLTITGKAFGTLKENIKVTVAGVPCIVQELMRTSIKCLTGEADTQFLQRNEFPGASQCYPLV